MAGSAPPISGGCAGAPGLESVTGGYLNTASGYQASVSGGDLNLASDAASAVSGGCQNVAGSASALTGTCLASPGTESVTDGYLNTATGYLAIVTGGTANQASTSKSAILGGHDHTVDGACQSVPATDSSC